MPVPRLECQVWFNFGHVPIKGEINKKNSFYVFGKNMIFLKREKLRKKEGFLV